GAVQTSENQLLIDLFDSNFYLFPTQVSRSIGRIEKIFRGSAHIDARVISAQIQELNMGKEIFERRIAEVLRVDDAETILHDVTISNISPIALHEELIHLTEKTWF